MDRVADRGSLDSSQDRHTTARLPRRMTLGTRLALSVAITVAVVVTVLTLGGMRIAERMLRADLLETARVTSVALADDLELREEPVTREAILPLLRDFMSAGVDLYSISVFRIQNGAPVDVLSTSELAPPANALVSNVLRSGDTAWSEPTPEMAIVGTPIRQENTITGVVTVAVSLRTVAQLRRTSTVIAIGGAVIAMGGITLLIHLMARKLILAPLYEIRGTIARASTGDLTARAHVRSEGELKEVAQGLNAMLFELHDLHASLNERIAAATGELQTRNEQIVRSYESVLELRETAARAQELAAIGQTVANVAHQIGTPLNLVSGHVQLLQHEIADPGLQRRLTIVQEQVGRVVSAVRDLLERARPSAQLRPVDIGTIATRLVEATRTRLAAAHVIVELHAAPGLPAVQADETQLELALLNLISNAADAMPDGGRLTITVSSTASGVRVVVADTGPGIPEDVLPRIFEPWVTTKPSGRGSGLGLSITRDVVANIGGSIDVASTAGRGTSFTIELPAAAAAPTNHE